MDQLQREAFWRGHVDAFRGQRGLQRDYCRRHGLIPRELRKWRTRFYGPVRQPTDERRPPDGPEPRLREFSYAPAQDAPGEVAGTVVVRRRWTSEQKRQLVWEGLNSGQSLARFARRHGIHASVAHRWLREFARPVLAAGSDASSAFATVQVSGPSALLPLPAASSVGLPAALLGNDMIEIELASGRRLRVGPAVDADALRRVITVLETAA